MGMHEKRLRREYAKMFTEDGLPRDAKDWLPADWQDLYEALETIKRKVKQRHEYETCRHGSARQRRIRT